MKENRIISFIIVTLVYILATVIGIFLYNMLDLEILLKVFILQLLMMTISVSKYWNVTRLIIQILQKQFNYWSTTLMLKSIPSKSFQ